MYLIFIPITVQARQKEWGNVHTTSNDNGFHLRLIHNLNITVFKRKKQTTLSQTNNRKHSLNSRIIANLCIMSPTYLNTPI
jgi:hypothetical protein